MKKVLLAFIFLANVLFANEQIAPTANLQAEPIIQDEIDFQNKVSNANNPSYITKTNESMNDYFERIASEMGFTYGPNTQKDKFFYNSSSAVSVLANDKDFGKAVVIAYDKAVIEMQAQYIVDIFGKIATEKIKENFANYSTDAREFPEFEYGSKLEAIFDKTLDFVGANLDDSLKKLGVEPENIKNIDKKDIFRDKFFQLVTTTAYGNISGLIPIETRVSQDASTGAYEVGVVGVISSKTRQIARDMASKRESLIEGRGMNLLELLPQKKEDFIKEVGLRLAYNEEGKPAILSYGIWSYGGTNTDPYLLKREKEIAQNTAREKADAAISEFINTNISFKNEQKTGEIIAQTLKREVSNEGENISEQMTKNIIDESLRKIRTSSKGTIKGNRTLKTWEAKDSNGINYIGVVRFYTYENVAAIDNLLGKKKVVKEQKPAKKTKQVERVSKRINDIDDF